MVKKLTEIGGLCCAGFSPVKQMILGGSESTPPCVETEFEVLTDNERGMFPEDGTSGWYSPNSLPDGTFLNPIMLVVPPQPDFVPLNASWQTTPAGPSVPLGMIDLTKTYTFSFEIIRTQPEDALAFPTTYIVIQTQNKYYQVGLGAFTFPTDGVQTYTIAPGDWVAGNAPAWSVHGITPEQGALFIDLNDFGSTYNGFQIGNMHLTYIDCI